MKHLQCLLLLGACLFLFSAAVKLQPIGDQCGYIPEGLKNSRAAHDAPKPLPAVPNAFLRHVSVMIRHGDRTPIAHISPTYACWPNAPEWHCHVEPEDLTEDAAELYRLYQLRYLAGRNLNPGTCFQGQLTDRGINQEIHNGRILRARYIEEAQLLPTSFDPKVAYLRSDDVPRVILSAESLLLGLWPANASAPACSQPTPWNLYLMDLALENILPNAAVCPLVGSLRTAFLNSPEYQKHYAAVSGPLAAAVGRYVNVPVNYLVPDAIQDCFTTHACHSLEFPSGLTQDLYNAAIVDESWIYGALMNFTSPKGANWATLAMGSFIQDLMTEIDNAVVGRSGRKFALYSGHDTSILPFLHAFGVWDGVWPRYASMIRVEIYQSRIDSSLSVRVIYNDKEMKLPGCSGVSPCPYPIFQSVAKKIIAAQAECPNAPAPPPRAFGIRE